MWWLILGIVVGALVYYKVIKPARYWADKDVAYISAWTQLTSVWYMAARKKHFVEIFSDVYKAFPNDRYVGFVQFGMGTPGLLIRDLDLIGRIGVKEFDSFHDHMHLASTGVEPLFSTSLIHLHGDKWKQMRATLSPAFTSSKLKNMYHLMEECAENVVKHFRNKGEVDVEMKDVVSRFANDVIATTAFGIQVDSMNDTNDEFYMMGKTATDFTAVQLLKMFLLNTLSPKLVKLLRIRLFPEAIAGFFTKIVKRNIRNRVEEGIIRPDLIHLLLEAQKGQLKHDIREDEKEGFATVEESNIGRDTKQIQLTEDHIVAQALLFFFAGFETVSRASSLVVYELAVNPDVQKKLQEEIDEVMEKYGQKVSYEAVMAMKYLDQVICESLRMWPPAVQIDRYCNNDYTIQPKNPKERAVIIEKGMVAMIPIICIHRDPRYFPDPDRFDPERFSDENKSKILTGSYMPFGVGPRNCIGSRFALLEMKILFFHLFANFDVVPNEKTEIPLKLSPNKVNMSPENGFQLRLKPRKVV